MKNYICTTCGTQYNASKREPEACPICKDERQYVAPKGQEWTTLDVLQRDRKLIFHKLEENLYGIGMTPNFAIGQRALLVITPKGNMLWGCISLINDAAIDIINNFGGLDAIAISHPHFYSSMIEWSLDFGNIPVYLHQKDKQWVQRPDEAIHFWTGDKHQILDGLTLINAGGHFDGGTVLHWPNGAGGKGCLLSGDILQVAADRKHVSFMYSYPNMIPLNEEKVTHITESANPFSYDRIYGAWWNKHILNNAEEAVRRSAQRYIEAIQ